jgi:hypothetical protein
VTSNPDDNSAHSSSFVVVILTAFPSIVNDMIILPVTIIKNKIVFQGNGDIVVTAALP